MDSRIFATSLGPVKLWGDLERFSPTRPLLLMIRGAFPEADQLVRLGETFAHADFAWCDLPGMHSPFFARASLKAFAVAIGEVFDMAFPGRRVNVLGLSMGGLVALQLRHRCVRTVIAVDPPLSTTGLWPMRERLRLMAEESAQQRDWIWNVFGVRGDEAVNRDYRDVLDGLHRPTRVLIGAEPLNPERPVTRMPSLVSEADRDVYLAHPGVEVRLVDDAGHNLPRDGQKVLLANMRQAIPPPRSP